MIHRCRWPRSLSRLAQHHIRGRRRHHSTSANPIEISHFDGLASTWWAPQGPSKLLHEMNPLRHDFIRSCTAIPTSPQKPSQKTKRRYLDVGCGGGIFAESAARLVDTAHVLAIDASNEVIKVAKRHALQDPLLQEPGRLVYENKAIEDLTVPKSIDEQFDVLTLFEVIEHISLPASFLDRCMRFVKPGGWIVLSTIARSWTSWLTTKVVAEDLIGLVPRGTHDWDKYINEAELRRFFEERPGWGGDAAIRSQGVIYVPALGWQTVSGSETFGNYFLGVRRNFTQEECIC